MGWSLKVAVPPPSLSETDGWIEIGTFGQRRHWRHREAGVSIHYDPHGFSFNYAGGVRPLSSRPFMFVVERTGTGGRLRTFDTFTSAAIAALEAFRLTGDDLAGDPDAPIAMLVRVSPALQAQMALAAESEPDNPSIQDMVVRLVERGLHRQ